MMSYDRHLKQDLMTQSSADRLEQLYEMVDDLHTTISENGLSDVTGTSARETVLLLQEMIYTLQQTVDEVQATNRRYPRPHLRIVPKPGEKAG